MDAGAVWSELAPEWAAHWGGVVAPVHQRLIAATRIGPGTRVLDVGCGSGEFLAALGAVGAVVAGADPAPAMLGLARVRAPGADLRPAGFEELPWDADSQDVVTAVNALQFADDTVDALTEAARVTRPGGLVAIANWAEGALSDLDAIEAALAAEAGEDPVPDGDLRVPGGLEEVLVEAGLGVCEAGLVDVPWEVPDAVALVKGVLLGEDEAAQAARTATVLDAARAFRTSDGGYRLVNRFRFAIGVVPA
ncbi:class I SAM-dependent methyltransferase [Occultella gossypii]|uniref:Methyltransferase domain-containing protein n=1 Tax=Occultella gossypii TaxID=2800820 RepID=A0ABS7S3M3_9MICO|nr:methyltransferase domain-containing protein [Occultella gossypii]MBZ2194928.1 methyltransferase domain-containing protein [Occultella gossypii]